MSVSSHLAFPLFCILDSPFYLLRLRSVLGCGCFQHRAEGTDDQVGAGGILVG